MGSGGFRVLGVGSSKTYYFGYEDYEQDYTGNQTLNPKPSLGKITCNIDLRSKLPM